MKRHASAKWQGGLKDGHGTLTTESEVLNESQYSFKTRFEEGKGTNPEELIAAAHAGCFSMALSAALEKAGFKARSIKTKAQVTLEKLNESFAISAVHLELKADIPNIPSQKFEEIAQSAKQNCPVSKVLKAEITLNTTLES